MSATILVLGAAGETGRALTPLLVSHTDANLLLGGRDAARLEAAARALGASPRVATRTVDARDLPSLARALAGVDLVISAAPLADALPTIARAAATVGADVLDVQYAAGKLAALRAVEPQLVAAGRMMITDGGFHPGVPAALARAAESHFDTLRSALVSSVIQIDWRKLQVRIDTMDEFVEALDKSEAGHLVNGTWRVEPWTSHDVMARFRFDPPFGERTCFIMGLDEMRIWAEAHPGLERAGFYVGGFNPVVDFAVFPLMYGARRLGVPYRPLSRLLLFCLRTFSRPPFGTLLRLEAEGERAGQPHRLVLTVGHDDGYVFTAIPVVAAVRQWLDGSIRRPGVQLQALAVEPARFLQDMQAMGVRVTWEEAAQTEAPALAGAGT